MTLIERMARAIDPAAWDNLDNVAWLGTAHYRRRNAKHTAIAVLKVIRERTPAILSKVTIDAALSEAEKSA